MPKQNPNDALPNSTVAVQEESAAPRQPTPPYTEIAPAAPQPVQVQPITRVPIHAGERGLVLKSHDEVVRFCEVVCRTEAVPEVFRNKPALAYAVVQNGAEIGLSPMLSLQCTMVVDGRCTIFGDTPLAMCQASPVWDHKAFREYSEGTTLDDYAAVCEVGRVDGTKLVSKFGVKDAKRAALWGKLSKKGNPGPWTFFPQRMLKSRARAFALRDLFADVLKGMNIAPAYDRESAEDYQDEIARTVHNNQAALPEPTPEVDPVAQCEAVAAAMETTVDTAAK